MISTFILATALAGQISANDGPPRTWVQGTVNGRATWLWGWQNANGWIQFHERENPQVFPQYRTAAKPVAAPRRPSPPILGAGMVLEANGTINSGLDLHSTHPTGIVETNDPDLGAKLDLQDRLPEVPNDPAPPELSQGIPWGWLALVGGLIFFLLLFDND